METYIKKQVKCHDESQYGSILDDWFNGGAIWNNGDNKYLPARYQFPMHLQLWSDKSITHSKEFFNKSHL